MEQAKKKKAVLTVLIALLMVLSFVSGALVSGLLLKTGEDAPSTDIVFTPDTSDNTTSDSTDGATADSSGPVSTLPEKHPEAVIEDAQGRWKGETVVNIFKVSYDETGSVTVQSAYGDKVVAPGTGNRYYFDIKNTGDTPIFYIINTEALLVFSVDGKEMAVPLQARFFNQDGKFLLGTENSFGPMTEFNGLEDRGGISVGNYVRYTLDWQWPFEGEDELDTLIGNLAAEGDEISLSVKINVTAQEDPVAFGGIPQTSDNVEIFLWISLAACALCILVLLFFARKSRREEA